MADITNRAKRRRARHRRIRRKLNGTAERPRLVLVISVDQFRADYLTRYAAEEPGGFARMLSEGAVFHSAYFDHFPTVTAIGHATMLSGATPAIHGIVGNSWFDRATNEEITSVSDKTVPLLGGAGLKLETYPYYDTDKHTLRIDEMLDTLNTDFAEILVSGKIEQRGPYPEEANEPDLSHLKRLAMKFDRHHFGSLRALIDRVNGWAPTP